MPEEAGKLAAIGIGIFLFGWLLYELLKSKEDVPIYRCPVCGKVVKKYAPKCYYCKTPLKWGNPSSSHSKNEYKAKLSEYIGIKAWHFGGYVCIISIIGFFFTSILCSYFPPANISPINTLLNFFERFAFFTAGVVVARPLEALMK